MIPKPLDQVTEDDLLRLVEEGISEDIRLEYKAEFPSYAGEQKYDLHADWSAMANTEGGDILYGVREQGGLPIELVGVEVQDFDNLKQQLLNKVFDGIKPQLPFLRIVDVKLRNGRSVVMVRIPKSWMGPHRVTLSRHGHFYARSPSGNYQLDVDGLRAAFLASHSFGEQVKNFVAERLVRIKAGRAPVRLVETGRVVFHVIPLGTHLTWHTPRPLTKEILLNVELLLGHIGQPRYNLTGCISSDCGHEEESSGYLQIFRDGSLEWVGPLFSQSMTGPKLPGESLVYELNKALRASIKILRGCDIAPPFAVVLSFIGIEKYQLVSASRVSHPCGEEDFTLPDVLFEGTDGDVAEGLRPIYNSLWNAFGLEKCPDQFLRN